MNRPSWSVAPSNQTQIHSSGWSEIALCWIVMGIPPDFSSTTSPGSKSSWSTKALLQTGHDLAMVRVVSRRVVRRRP
ncbi:MAG: hypothetical protein PHS14_04835 [Elusimicrobia bacterium]|nr:hypothetical protein [Elusimicrobiota bacterium]